MKDKDYTPSKGEVKIEKIFTYDLIPAPGFGNAKFTKNAFRNINRMDKIKQLFDEKNPLN